MTKRKPQQPPPPIARELAKSKLTPIFAILEAAAQAADRRFKDLNDAGFLSDVDKIPRAGMYQSYVVTATRALLTDEERIGNAKWIDVDKLQLLLYGGVMLRFNRVDSDLRPARNNTERSIDTCSQGLFSCVTDSQGDSEEFPILTVGVQWDYELLRPPSLYLLSYYDDSLLWSTPIVGPEAPPLAIPAPQPQPIPAGGAAAKPKGATPRSKKIKDADTKKETGGDGAA
jgi:hypothetical protein